MAAPSQLYKKRKRKSKEKRKSGKIRSNQRKKECAKVLPDSKTSDSLALPSSWFKSERFTWRGEGKKEGGERRRRRRRGEGRKGGGEEERDKEDKEEVLNNCSCL